MGWFTMGVPPKLSWGVVGTGVLNMPGVPGVPNWVVGVWGPPAPKQDQWIQKCIFKQEGFSNFLYLPPFRFLSKKFLDL